VCGIYGILQLDATAAPAEALRAMSRLTVHRGPDDEGAYVDGPLAFGMRRLSIIDVGGGHQPLSNEDGTLWLVANGEIYNYQVLRDMLVAQGHRFRTRSDCETILHLYETYGDDCVTHLNGMFAFALWDTRRQRLLVGRDRLGVKPIYIHNDGRRIVFASEAKAILTVPGVRAQLDPAALSSYLMLGYVPAPQSMFRGIRKIPPATVLIAGQGVVEERRYWRIPADIDRSCSEKEWAVRVRAQLERSTRMQMVSDVPIGAFLSGGVDSSAGVALMATHSLRPVKTYAIGFGGGGPRTTTTSCRMHGGQQLFRTDHHEIIVRPDVVALLPQLMWHMDEPIADTAFITTYLVSQFARHDVTVILSGVGGDELFGGYRRYLGGHYQAYFDWLPALRRAATALGESCRAIVIRRSSTRRVLRRGFLSSAGLSVEERHRSYVEVFPRMLPTRYCASAAMERTTS
jgi:asparagine synthase (glutamine-hydrolysing)